MPNSVDPHLGARWRNNSRVLRAERRINATVRKTLDRLFKISIAALKVGNYDASVLDSRMTEWRDLVTGDVLPDIESMFTSAWRAADRGKIDPNPYAIRYIEARTNELVRVADEVFDAIRVELVAGRELHEGIPELAARIDQLLLGAGAERWTNRARTIARTETLGANAAGSHGSARNTADVLGVDASLVAKEWLATDDGRTRESHLELNGQFVYGLDTPFDNGCAYACDDAGPADEVINCRCTTLYHYPGDPDYPGRPDLFASGREDTTMNRSLTAAGEDDEQSTGVVVVALPTADDPVRSIGDEDKHCTLLYFGDIPGAGGDNENPGLTEDFRGLLSSAIAVYAASISATEESVTGVESLGDDGARVWMLAGDTMPSWRTELLDTDTEVATVLSDVEQYPSYTPHVTIGYPEGGDVPAEGGPEAGDLLDEATETAAAAISSITFDRLALWWGGEQTEWVAGETETDVTETIAAAAGEALPTPAAPSTNDAGDPVPPISLDTPAEEASEERFHGVCMVENVQTGDGRAFAPGSVEWDGLLPLPVGWQVEDAPGHDGSIICGRIDTMERVGNAIRYEGTWDIEGAGWETHRLVEGQFLRGISVDVDDVDGTLIDAEGNEIDPMDVWGDEEGLLWVTTRGRIRSAALCRVPAFAPVDNPDSVFVANGTWADAEAAPADDAEPVETPTDEEVTAALVAAATALDLPARTTLPPLSDFTDPQLDRPTPITVTADGRVFGHVAAWGTCHIGVQGRCVTPPHSVTGYAHFLKGETITADGLVATGVLTMGTGHASADLGALPAAAHYDNTGTIFASVGCGEDEHGIWIAGRLHGDPTDEQLATIRAAGSLSGDWRRISGNLELVAALAVNVPGFPIPRVSMAASGDRQLSLVASGIVPPVVETPVIDTAAIASAVVATLDRRERLRAARDRIEQSAANRRAQRMAAAAARIGG